MPWSPQELGKLSPLLEHIYKDPSPLQRKTILLLCSAGGDVALWLGKRASGGKIIGLELDDGLLELSRRKVEDEGLEESLEFREAEKHRIPFPDNYFDASVSEFILFPRPTGIGQRRWPGCSSQEEGWF